MSLSPLADRSESSAAGEEKKEEKKEEKREEKQKGSLADENRMAPQLKPGEMLQMDEMSVR